MFTVNKTLVATAALMAVGLVAAIDLAQSRAQPTAAAIVSTRFPAASEMMISISLDQPEQAQDTGAADCVREHWPYIADECLTATDGERRKPPARTIPIGRGIVGNSLHLASR